MKASLLCAVFAAVAVSACDSVVPTLSTAGSPAYIPPPVIGPAERTPATLFYLSYEKAWKLQADISEGRTVTNDTAVVQFKQMARDGFDVVRANCSDFFRSGGENQKWILFSRDVVGAAGTLTTGILALATAGTLPIAIAALTTSTLYAGLDIYTKNFLFGAENIDSVWTLVRKALNAHEEAVFGADAQLEWTFGTARDHINYHQAQCLPARIRALAVDAIRSGKIEAATSGAESESAVTLNDRLIAQQIRADVGMTLTPNAELLAALCWSARETLTAPQLASVTQELLPTGLAPRGPAGGDVWHNVTRSRVRAACNELSPRTQTRMKDQIDAWKKALAEPPPPAPALPSTDGVPAPAAAPPPARPRAVRLRDHTIAPASSGGSRHVTIRVAQ
jgi:hypothetical protein